MHEEAICEVIHDMLTSFSCIFFTDIQEFYEVTLLNSQKALAENRRSQLSCKVMEKTSLLASCHDNLQKSAEVTLLTVLKVTKYLLIPVNTKIIYTSKEVVVISSGNFSSSNDY